MESREKVGWIRKRRRKSYYIYHFYFRLGPLCWWSLHFKIHGNKRVRPERLICREVKNDEVNYFPYELPDNLMDGWIEISKSEWNRIMTMLVAREELRRSRF